MSESPNSTKQDSANNSPKGEEMLAMRSDMTEIKSAMAHINRLFQNITDRVQDLEMKQSDSPTNSTPPKTLAAALAAAAAKDDLSVSEPSTEKESAFVIRSSKDVSIHDAGEQAMENMKTPKKATIVNGAEPPKTLNAKLKSIDLFDTSTPANHKTAQNMDEANKFGKEYFSALKKSVKFQCVKLDVPLTVPEVLTMNSKRVEHILCHKEGVSWVECLETVLMERLMMEFTSESSIERFSMIKDSLVYEMLIAYASPKTPKEFVKVLKDFKPSKDFYEMKLDVYNFSRELVPHINVHIVDFKKLYDALMLNDRTLCPPTWQAEKNAGEKSKKQSLVDILISSFPHDLGYKLCELFDIKTKTTFEQFLTDFKAALMIESEKADKIRHLSQTLKETYEVKKGSVKHQIANDSRLHNIEEQDDADSDAFLHAIDKPKGGKDGCFEMVLKGTCSKGSKCPHSHKREDLDDAHDYLVAQCKQKESDLKAKKYLSQDSRGSGGHIKNVAFHHELKDEQQVSKGERSGKKVYRVDTTVRCDSEEEVDSDMEPSYDYT